MNATLCLGGGSVGRTAGILVGNLVGKLVRILDGDSVGFVEGTNDCCKLGSEGWGWCVDIVLGLLVGDTLRSSVGIEVGIFLGCSVGSMLRKNVGWDDGSV